MSDLLLVTDQPCLPSWARALEREGHHLRSATTRAELLTELASSSVDGVLIDHAEWATGLLAGAPVREFMPHARVLVVAYPASLPWRTDLDALGIQDLVFGPVEEAALCRRVRRRFASGSPPLTV